MDFQNRIKELRKIKGVTQSQMAKDLGITIRTITNYENGKSFPNGEKKLETLAEYFNVEVSYLVLNDNGSNIEFHIKKQVDQKKHTSALLAYVDNFFASDEFSNELKDQLMKSLQESYWNNKTRL